MTAGGYVSLIDAIFRKSKSNTNFKKKLSSKLYKRITSKMKSPGSFAFDKKKFR